jgi:hypothetical protein
VSEKINIELSVEQAQAVRAWMSNHQAIVQNEEALRALEKAADKAGHTSHSMFEKAAEKAHEVGKEILGLATAFFTVHKAAKLFENELEAIFRRREKALEQQLDLGTVKKQALGLASKKGSDMTAGELEQYLEGHSTMEMRGQYAAFKRAHKDSGRGASTTASADISLAAGEFGTGMGMSEDQIVELAGAAAIARKQNPKLTGREATAQVFQLAGLSRNGAGDMKPLMEAVARQRRATGSDDRELQSFFLALSEGLEADLSEAIPVGEKVIANLSKQTGGKNKKLSELIASHGGIEKMVKTMRGGMGFAAGKELSHGTIQKTMAEMQEALGRSPEETVANVERQMAGAVSTPGMQVVALEHGLKLSQQKLRAGRPEMAMHAFRDEFVKSLTEFGGFASLDQANTALGKLNPSQPIAAQMQEMESMVRERQKMLRADKILGSYGDMYGFGGPGRTNSRPANEQEMRSAEALEQILEEIKKQTETIQNLEQQPREIRLPPNVQPQAGAAASLNDPNR